MLGLMPAASDEARADAVAEFLFWDAMGQHAGKAVDSIAAYRSERNLWKRKIAEAKKELERCGDCPAAKQKLGKWQRTENQFQALAGPLAAASGMPPVVARWLDIKMPTVSTRSELRGLLGGRERNRDRTIIVRPDWADDRPEMCRRAVDEHLACLRTEQNSGRALSPLDLGMGSLCWSSQKLYRFCGTKDYEAFHKEREFQELRAQGGIIPEIDGKHGVLKAHYGHVPASFVPKLPPPNVVAKGFTNGGDGYHFFMRKDKAGALNSIEVKRFKWDFIDLGHSACVRAGETKDAFDRRACDDFLDIVSLYEGKNLICRYQGHPYSAVPKHVYWYGERPAGADVRRLLERVPGHPVLRVGDARTNCPATIEEADELKKEYRRKVAKIGAGVRTIPGNAAIPRTPKEQELIKKKEAETQRIERQRQALQAFPLDGLFAFETTQEFGGELIKTAGKCISHKSHGVICRDEHGGSWQSRTFSRANALAFHW
ncbi:MAG: hypothetical protein MJE12_09690, partial [Alphaproteobacteria bacterium]|nr:hypothetical protein [Alphaproteobacteria bacterium]